MSLKAILFDLDGTLLPMNQDVFLKNYLGLLAKKLAIKGYEPNKMVESIMKGTYAMIENNGDESNEKVFWNTFFTMYPEFNKQDVDFVNEFYLNEFEYAKEFCGFNKQANDIVKNLKSKGLN